MGYGGMAQMMFGFFGLNFSTLFAIECGCIDRPSSAWFLFSCLSLGFGFYILRNAFASPDIIPVEEDGLVSLCFMLLVIIYIYHHLYTTFIKSIPHPSHTIQNGNKKCLSCCKSVSLPSSGSLFYSARNKL